MAEAASKAVAIAGRVAASTGPSRTIQLVMIFEVANPWVHATTRRVVDVAFAEVRASLRPFPTAPVLSVGRRVSKEGMISVGGSF